MKREKKKGPALSISYKYDSSSSPHELSGTKKLGRSWVETIRHIAEWVPTLQHDERKHECIEQSRNRADVIKDVQTLRFGIWCGAPAREGKERGRGLVVDAEELNGERVSEGLTWTKSTSVHSRCRLCVL